MVNCSSNCAAAAWGDFGGYRLVIVTKNGVEHVMEASPDQLGKPPVPEAMPYRRTLHDSTKATLGQRLTNIDDIKEMRLEYRWVQAADFHNVSLQAGERTQVHAVVVAHRKLSDYDAPMPAHSQSKDVRARHLAQPDVGSRGPFRRKRNRARFDGKRQGTDSREQNVGSRRLSLEGHACQRRGGRACRSGPESFQ